MKKLMSVLLALALVLSLNVAAMAANMNASGEDTGVAGAWETADTPIPQDKTINIKKELLSYNATSQSVFAPAFSYVYTVTPADVSGKTVTDETSDHESGVAVANVPVKQGITTGLKVNNGASGSATSAVGYLDFTNATVLTTSAAGGSNTYNITLDFTGVTFPQAGVYRYQVAETITKADHTTTVTYDNIAIKDASGTNPNTRWLDVYVDGTGAIYGYVCMAANDSVTPSTTKTNGFVTGSTGADKYYTYDLELSKLVNNDTYAKNSHPFPFTVIFKNTKNYSTTYTITETTDTGSTGITPAAASAPTWSGVAKVKDGVAITYTGIPAGVDVDVYETNDMSGVTYTVVTTVNGTDGTPDNNVSWGTAPATATPQATTKAAYESTKATVDTKDITDTTPTTDKQTLKITNTLLLISPTGVVLRIAPYVLILVGGIALLLVSRRRKAASEEE